MTERETAIMNEAFTVGRIYNRMGEVETPAEIQEKLERMCKAAAERHTKDPCESCPLQADLRVAMAVRQRIKVAFPACFNECFVSKQNARIYLPSELGPHGKIPDNTPSGWGHDRHRKGYPE